MQNLLLKALCEKNVGYERQEISSFFGSDFDNLNKKSNRQLWHRLFMKNKLEQKMQ